jgi:[NiFe] hydrogenase diaphorase moiety large subunit
MCDQGPALLVNGIALTHMNPVRIDQIADLVEAAVPLEEWPRAFFEVTDNIRRQDLLLDTQVRDGAALTAWAERGSDAILAEIEGSGLRGRGGAGFMVGTKWRLCREAYSNERFVVCNADEGEPGTFKDRVLLQSYPDAVVEGMTLCAGILGARRGYIYLRGEYRYLHDQLEALLQRRRAAGLLGTSILGRTGFDFDIELHMGAGAYICGEESALLESLEGRRGISRKRPPFPVVMGYRSRPTVVNNVETFLAAARIAVFGNEWFRSAGTAQSPGTKILSISGDCTQPGIYEYPFGVTIADVLGDCGAMAAQAVQVSGAAGATIPAREFLRRIAFEDVPTGGSFIVFDQRRDMLDMVRNFAQFFVHESCGFCTPCRVGGVLLRDLAEKVAAGAASQHDLEEMRHIGTIMGMTSHCGLGLTAPNPVLDTLEKFPQIYHQRLRTSEYAPSFDLDAALEEARRLTGRDDAGAHLRRDV